MSAAYVIVPGVKTQEQADKLGLVLVETSHMGTIPAFGYYAKDDAPGVKPTAAAIKAVLGAEAAED